VWQKMQISPSRVNGLISLQWWKIVTFCFVHPYIICIAWWQEAEAILLDLQKVINNCSIPRTYPFRWNLQLYR
jgi:hypothetical protein